MEVTVPNKLARKLKKQDGVCSYDDEPYAWGTKWGDLYYQGEDGKEYKIEGKTCEVDYKRTEEGYWDDEESESDEDTEAVIGSGECEEEEKEKEDKVFPCPDCEFCKKPKTWEQTKYIKGITFMNKDACLECYKKEEEKEEEEE